MATVLVRGTGSTDISIKPGFCAKQLDSVLKKWQEILDVIAETLDIPSALIMQVHEKEIEVFLSSSNPESPYSRGAKEHLGAGLYCEAVMGKGEPLLVPDATSDRQWQDNPDVPLGMISYYGVPFRWADGSVFGTLCVLDNKPNSYSGKVFRLIETFRSALEADLVGVESEHKFRQELIKSHNLTETYLNIVAELVLALDCKGNVTLLNDCGHRILGYEPHELIGANWFDVAVPENRRDEIRQLFSKVISGEDPTTGNPEAALMTRNGDVLSVQWYHTLLYDDDGAISGIIASGKDITERINREKILARTVAENAQLLVAARALFESHSFKETARKIFDACCKVTGARSGYVALLSKNGAENEVLFLESGGMPCHVDPSLPMPVRGLRADAYNNARVVWENDFMNSKWVQHMPDKHVYLKNVMFSPLIIEGQVVGIMGLANKETDFTPSDVEFARVFGEYASVALKRTRAEENLLYAKEQAEEANRVKSEFLAVMSHELRTPLNPIMGLSELLFEDETDEMRKDCLGMINEAGAHLLSLIIDILDFSKIESGTFKIEMDSIELSDFVHGIIKLLSSRAEASGLTLTLEMMPGLPSHINTDPLRLKQILINLIGNALKFTEEGTVTLSVKLLEEQINFSVTDTGIGMSTDEQRQVFKPFHQVDSSNTRKYGGTGLGLSISQKLAGLIGATLELESEAGKGSCFTVRMPAAAWSPDRDKVGESNTSHDDNKTEHKERPILIVEDDPASMLTLQLHLKKQYTNIDAAVTGAEALQYLEKKQYSVVLLDLQLPDISGWDLCDAIHHATKGGPRPWIVAQTARALDGDSERCLEHGFDAYLSKPITGSELMHAMQTAEA